MKIEYMIGEKFGSWVVIGTVLTEGYRKKWLCQCHCGKIREIDVYSLVNGKSKNCGCDRVYKRKDLKGEKFEFLTVISPAPAVNGRTKWLCKCDCGNDKITNTTSLIGGLTKSCGCQRKKLVKKDLKDKKFGRLIVIEEAQSINGKTRWLCKCDCGNEKEIAAKSLIAGVTESCGCLRKEKCTERLSLPNGEASFNRILGIYKIGAKKRGLEFDLSNDQFREITKQNCYYCGQKPSNIQKSKSGHGDFVYNGIDRIDNNTGYMIENCVPCCAICNIMKRDSSKIDFLNKIKDIYIKHFCFSS